ncbi:hypothetical protein PS664_01899 [Pseudomonas fluorescens]|nr:hypothetical protein PS664_01899 [Pseudomonas fluorescens]
MRAVAASVVLVGHTFSLVVPDSWYGKVMPFQSLAVVVFFWLSGFLIVYQCISKDNYSFGEYMIDCFSGIYILYIPGLIITFLVCIVFLGRVSPTAWDSVGHLLQLQHTPFTRMIDGVPAIKIYGGNSVLWTIAIEWWLYVFFGIAFFLRSMGRLRNHLRYYWHVRRPSLSDISQYGSRWRGRGFLVPPAWLFLFMRLRWVGGRLLSR